MTAAAVTRSGGDGGTLVLTTADVRACLDGATVLAAVERTLRALVDGDAESGPRAFMPAGSGAFFALPGALRDRRIVGVKWVSTLGGNPQRGFPKVRGTVLLSDSDTGRLRAVLDAKDITSMRTAALAAIAAKHCASPDSAVAAVVGFGAVGRATAALLPLALPVREIRVFGRRTAAVAAAAGELPRRDGVAVTAARSVEEAVTGADVVVTATGLTSDDPIVRRDWVARGATVCAVGSFQEVDADLVLRAKDGGWLVVDSWEGSAHRGAFAPLVADGRLRREDVDAELSDIVAGRKPGRGSPAESVVASLLGRGVLDVAVAAEVVDAASRRGLGRVVPIDTW